MLCRISLVGGHAASWWTDARRFQGAPGIQDLGFRVGVLSGVLNFHHARHVVTVVLCKLAMTAIAWCMVQTGVGLLDYDYQRWECEHMAALSIDPLYLRSIQLKH